MIYMTREKAIEELSAWRELGNQQVAHAKADDILCDLLVALGYGDVVEEYCKGEWRCTLPAPSKEG